MPDFPGLPVDEPDGVAEPEADAEPERDEGTGPGLAAEEDAPAEEPDEVPVALGRGGGDDLRSLNVE